MTYSLASSPGARILRRSGVDLFLCSLATVFAVAMAFATVPFLFQHPWLSMSGALVIFILMTLAVERREPAPIVAGPVPLDGDFSFLSEVSTTAVGFRITIRQVEDIVILGLHGKMTLGNGDELFKAYVQALLAHGYTKLLVDLKKVPYIDSAGLGEVVRTYTTVSRAGGSLKLMNLSQRIEDLAGIAKLLYSSESEAIDSFGKSGVH